MCTSASWIKELNSRIYSIEAHIFLLEIVDNILFLVFVFIEQNKTNKDTYFTQLSKLDIWDQLVCQIYIHKVI